MNTRLNDATSTEVPDIQQLTILVKDLCAFTLEQNGISYEAYNLHLRVAFHSQKSLYEVYWDNLKKQVEDHKKVRDKDLAQFSQLIATCIANAINDPLAIKLIKTQYMSVLDNERTKCELACKALTKGELPTKTIVIPAHNETHISSTSNNHPKKEDGILNNDSSFYIIPNDDDKNIQDSFSSFVIMQIDNEETPENNISPQDNEFVLLEASSRMSISLVETEELAADIKPHAELLKKYAAYLDALLTLPLILQKTTEALYENTGINYTPDKCAEILSYSIHVMSEGLTSYQVVSEFKANVAEKIINFMIETYLPHIPFDNKAMARLKNFILPGLENFFKRHEQFQQIKTKYQDQEKLLTSLLDIKFYDLTSVLKDLLIVPANECAKLAENLTVLSVHTKNAAYADNMPQQIKEIMQACENLDVVSQFIQGIDEALLPPWIKKANDYYANLQSGVKKINEGMVSFYGYMLDFFPKPLEAYLKNEHDQRKKLYLIYTVFLELTQQKLTGSSQNSSLEKKFFEQFMAIHLPLEKANFTDYQKFNLEVKLRQLTNKNLVELITKYKSLDNNDVEYHIEAMIIHKLNQLAQTDLNNKEKVKESLLLLKELGLLKKEIEQKNLNHLITPVVLQFVLDYEHKHYLPKIEGLLDNQSRMDIYDLLKQEYSRLSDNLILNIENTDVFNITEEDEENIATIKSISQQLLDSSLNTEPSPHIQFRDKDKIRTETLDQSLEYIKPILRSLRRYMRKQSDHLKILLPTLNEENAKILCEKKQAYITAILELLNTAEQLSAIEILATIEKNKVINQATSTLQRVMHMEFMRLVKSAIVNFGRVDPTSIEHLFTAALGNENIFMQVHQARQNYFNELAQVKASNFVDELNDPLSLNGLVKEDIYDIIIDDLVKPYVKQLKISLKNQIENKVTQIAIDQVNNLASLSPYPKLTKFLIDTLMTSSFVNEKIQMLQNTGSASVDTIFSQIESRIYSEIKQKLKLNIDQLKRELLDNILNKTMDNKQTDLLITLYLKYQGMLQNHDITQQKNVIDHLFAPILSQDNAIKQTEIEAILAAFLSIKSSMINIQEKFSAFEKDYETILNNKSSDPEAKIHSKEHKEKFKKDIEESLTTSDASDQMLQTLIMNKLLQNKLIAAKNAGNKHVEKIAAKQSLLITEAFQNTPSANSNDAVKEALQPSSQLAYEINKENTKIKINEANKKIQDLINDNNARIESSHTGKTAIEVEAGLMKKYPLYGGRKLFNGVMEYGSWGLNLASIGMSIASAVTGGLSIKGAILAGIGIGVTGATLIGPLVIAGVIFLVRFGVKLTQEILKNKSDYTEIINHPEKSTARKVFDFTILALKHTAVSLAKTIISDYLYEKAAKVTSFFRALIWPVNALMNGLQRHPTDQKLQDENAHLVSLQSKINVAQNLLTHNQEIRTTQDKKRTFILTPVMDDIADKKEDVIKQLNAAQDLRLEDKTHGHEPLSDTVQKIEDTHKKLLKYTKRMAILAPITLTNNQPDTLPKPNTDAQKPLPLGNYKVNVDRYKKTRAENSGKLVSKLFAMFKTKTSSSSSQPQNTIKFN